MVEMFGVYALLLAGWGLWKAHAGSSDEASSDDAPAAPSPTVVAHERGAAARRHLSTLP